MLNKSGKITKRNAENSQAELDRAVQTLNQEIRNANQVLLNLIPEHADLQRTVARVNDLAHIDSINKLDQEAQRRIKIYKKTQNSLKQQ